MVDSHPLPLSSDAGAAGRLMRRASLASMSVAVALIAAKTAAWLITDSVSMLSSLVDSALDLVSSSITFLAIRQALVPADADHRFGHGKAEALAGTAQAGFIAASAAAVVLTVIDRFLNPRPVQQEMVGVAVSGLAILLTVALVTFQNHVMRRTGSIAIGADRAHYLTDLVTTGSSASPSAKGASKKAVAKRGTVKSAETPKAKTTLPPGTRVNVNTASQAELEELPLIGPVKAAAIIAGRPFKTVEDLKNVKGIGDKTFERIKDIVNVK